MKITFLGTAGSTMSKERGFPSILVDDNLLLDCGEGTTQKLLKLEKMGSIKTICLTHLHNDHFLGLFSLLWHYWINKRTEDLELIGPEGTKKTVETILELINTPQDMMSSFQVRYKELKPANKSASVQDKSDLTYASVDHRIPALAFRIERDGKSSCYTGDSKPVQTVIDLASKCDLLICESTLPDEMADFAHDHYHFTPSDAAHLASESDCKRLVLFHISSFFANQMDRFKQQAEKALGKSVIIAKDLMEIDL
ncbi:MAG: ribonuclease Z [Candidatus Lokiarchaeota archaeon]|nr:ribonuclease Z [Candidatus Lokiarchaeota archaeon]